MEVVSLSECRVSYFKYQAACWQQGRAGKLPPALPNGVDKHHQLQENKRNSRIFLPSVCYTLAKSLFCVIAKGSLNMLQYWRNAFPLKKLLYHKQWPLSCLKRINYCSSSESEWLPVGTRLTQASVTQAFHALIFGVPASDLQPPSCSSSSSAPHGSHTAHLHPDFAVLVLNIYSTQFSLCQTLLPQCKYIPEVISAEERSMLAELSKAP